MSRIDRISTSVTMNFCKRSTSFKIYWGLTCDLRFEFISNHKSHAWSKPNAVTWAMLMEIVFTEGCKAFVLLIFFVVTFLFSFLVQRTIFNELDYYEIKYTLKTKKRTLWFIFFILASVTLWLHVILRLLSRL